MGVHRDTQKLGENKTNQNPVTTHLDPTNL